MQIETSPKAMREFGLVTGGLVIALFGGFIPWLWQLNWPLWLSVAGSIGALLILWALIHPASLKYVYQPWMKFSLLLGAINTRIILFLLFFILFLPMGLIMRLLGKDPMQRKRDNNSSSYRQLRDAPSKDHMETPY